MKIYTRTGDDGMTSLFGGGRVKKNNIRVEAYGTVDELNAVLGIVRAISRDEKIKEIVQTVQNLLFTLGADLATPFDVKSSKLKRIRDEDIKLVEDFIDELEMELEPLKNFILPGGVFLSSVLHLARAVCRRAERRIISLAEVEEINDKVIPFINRLSDLFFVLARYANKIEGVDDIKWGV